MSTALRGFVPYAPEDVRRYVENGWWPGMTLGELLDRAAERHPDREAFVDDRARLGYGEASAQAEAAALGLLEAGVKPGDRVLLQLPNWHEFGVAYFALQKMGAVPVLLIDRYRQHEIGHLIRLTGATAWLVPERFRNTDFRPIVADVRRAHPEVERVVWVRAAGAVEDLRWEDLCRAGVSGGGERLARVRPDPQAVAHLAPTGGTTGLPKVVPRIHESLVCAVEHAARAWDYDGDDTCLLAGPIGHDLTFTKGFLGGVAVGARLVFLDHPDMDAVCRTIERERVTAVVWVPTLANRFVQHSRLGEYDLSSLAKMHSGGAASSPELIRAVRALGCVYYNGYGGTEGQTTITRRDDDLDTVCATVGRPTCPYDEYRVLDPLGREVPPDHTGELVIKGPGVFSGYLDNPEENAVAFTPDGWFRTGDLAQIDERGYVTLVGRVKEMINRGGESISASEVERLVGAHPAVVAVAVVPMPDPDLGERVCAYVQLRPGESASFEDIVSFLKERGASVLHWPERVVFVDDLPLTKTGKVDKVALRRDIAARLGVEGSHPG
ncbi:AMP-binding protein [Deferrisoma palaeochoriense]